jgi:polysaccharide export outer membrane protein
MQSSKLVGVLVTVATLLCARSALPEQAGQSTQDNQSTQNQTAQAGKTNAAPTKGVRPTNYVLGPGDEIVILGVDMDEIANKPMRVSTAGELNLPMAGRIHVDGMTIDKLEEELVQRLSKFIQHPQLAVNVTQFKSQPVNVIGSVKTPGVIQLEGRKTLFEVLSMAGGPMADAGYRAKITRKPEWGPIPLPSAMTDANGFSIAEVNLRAVMNAANPQENIQILPYDSITVPRAELVYVMGEVRKPGGFPLNDKENISVLEALALAEGFVPGSASDKAKIFRPMPGSERAEININIKEIYNGKTKDPTLEPQDILFVPGSYAKKTFRMTLDRAVQITTGLAIYGRPY